MQSNYLRVSTNYDKNILTSWFTMLILWILVALVTYSIGKKPKYPEETSSSQSILPHSPTSFTNILHRFSHSCGRKNIVKSRVDGYMFLNMSESREWSLKSDFMHSFLGLHSNHSHVPICETLQDIIESSKYSLEPSNHSNQRPCIIKWLSRESICHVMSKYRNILILGDSLSRHFASAMLMILSEDFQYGGVIHNVPGFNYTNLQKYCTCDGIFSEFDMCRQYLRPVELSPADIMKNKYCVLYPAGRKVKTHIYIDDSLLNYSSFNFSDLFCGPERTLRFIMIQGGSHYSFAADQYTPVVRVLMERLTQSITACEYNITDLIRVVYSGVPMVHPSVVEKFPFESDESVLQFTRDMTHFFHDKYPYVIILDFLNLTRDANRGGRNSDGFHQLSDTNMIKMMTVFNVMHAMANTSYRAHHG